MKLPEPPPDSCLVVDADEHEWPRLTWAKPMQPADHAFALLATVGFGGGFAYLVSLLVRPGPGLQGKDFFACLGGACFLGLMFLLLAHGLASNLIYGPTPRRITFGPNALLFEPALQNVRDNQQTINRFERVNRDELGAIRTHRLAGVAFLTIDSGLMRLQVGKRLDERELEWLADVLRAWAGRQEGETSPVPRLPAGSWIKVEAVEDEPGAWRLSWQPPTHTLTGRLTRWSMIASWVPWLVGWGAFTIALKVFCIGALVQQFLGGWDWLVLGLLAFLILLLYASTWQARFVLREIRNLAANPRPESITLTETDLTHDPGNFVRRTSKGVTMNAGKVRTIPRSEIHDGSLILIEGCIVLIHGQDQFGVGRCLRAPEREWLAEVLRAWLRGGTPALPEAGGSHPPEGQSLAP